jgi:ligand-binding SRPBCC domain-containing protein
MKAMETIRLGTWINAPVERCFLLSLSVDLRVAAARSTPKSASVPAPDGMIGEGETLTFRGSHFGVYWRHTSLIEKLRPHSYYRDVMIAGPFQYLEHDHHFAAMDDGTRMRDDIRFSARGGLMGRLATRIYLRRRLKAYLMERNAMIKRLAESEDWHKYLVRGVEDPAAPAAKGDGAKQRDGNALLQALQQIAVTRPPTS